MAGESASYIAEIFRQTFTTYAPFGGNWTSARQGVEGWQSIGISVIASITPASDLPLHLVVLWQSVLGETIDVDSMTFGTFHATPVRLRLAVKGPRFQIVLTDGTTVPTAFSLTLIINGSQLTLPETYSQPGKTPYDARSLALGVMSPHIASGDTWTIWPGTFQGSGLLTMLCNDSTAQGTSAGITVGVYDITNTTMYTINLLKNANTPCMISFSVIFPREPIALRITNLTNDVARVWIGIVETVV